MADQKFAIQKQIFEIDAFSKEQVHEIQNSISRLVNYNLVQKMESYFGEIIPADLLLRMDQLVLDIGEVNFLSMEEEIEQRFMEALEYEFSQRLEFLKSDSNRSLAGINVETTNNAKFELFEYFLLYGVLPWYADKVKFNIDELLNQLYNANRSTLRSIIQRAGKDPNARFRMSRQLSDSSIKQVINIIEPAESGYIFQTQEELIKVQHNKQIVKEDADDFKKTVWLFILDYLLDEMGSRFEKKMFIKSSLIQIAAHYNISYQHLLHSFYDVMITLKETEIFQPLKTVIYELFTDETEVDLKNKLLTETHTAIKPDILSLSSGIELLQYYFSTGSLPHAYQKMSRYDIKQLLLSLTKLAPVAISKLLLLLHKQHKSIFNLYQVIDTSQHEAFAKLSYGGNINQIAGIASLFSNLQQAQAFSNATGGDFKNETWKYLLNYFLFNGAPVNDDKAIIEYLIKRFALEMNYTGSNLVPILKNSLQKITQPGAEVTGAETLLKEVLFAMDKSKVEVENIAGYYHDEMQGEENIFSTEYTTDQLSAVIAYMLQYGAVPWWGHNLYGFSLSELIAKLYKKDAGSMLLLFRKAIAVSAMKTRLILEIPVDIFKSLMQKLPAGAELMLQIDELMDILNESKQLRYYKPEFVQKTVFAIAWEIYSSSGYNLFSVILFYYETIKRFSALLKIESEILISELITSAEKMVSVSWINNKNFLQILLIYLEKQKQEAALINDIMPGIVLEDKKAPQQSSNTLTLINESETIQQYFKFTTSLASDAVAGLRNALQYFLQWNRLPDSFTFLKKEEQKILLREILAILYLDNPVTLRLMIEDKANAGIARAYLDEIFSVAEGGQEKRMAEFLLGLNLPVSDILIDKTAAENYFAVQEIANFDLAKIFLKERNVVDTTTANRVLEESKRVLNYFLKYNRLPDDIAITEKGAIEYLLKEIIFYLFAQNKMFIHEQFKNPNASITAKLYLYDLLSISYDIRSSEVKDFLQELRENELEKMLLETFKEEQGFFEKDPAAVIIEILQAANAEAIKQDDHLFLSSASFANMILNRYGTDMLLKLASLKINANFAPGPIIQDWLVFLQKAVPTSLYKEKILELFNRFNILFISGSLNIYSSDTYTIAFINYLSNQLGADAGEIFRQLFDYTLQPEKKSVASIITNQYNIMQQVLRQVISRDEELKKIDATITASEEKKLSLILKQDIDGYRKQLSKSIKKEMEQHTEIVTAAETDMNEKFKPETGESIYIANAGLVLLHPYLETYFSRTGLMENNVFIDDNSRNRAVLLLQYLATGNTEHAEHEMVLNKILCNIPLQEAIAVSFIATETEIEVTRELLEVVIERWDKMKNTSPEGFQNSFIMRDGMLNFREDYWNLKVEQRGYDVLLQTLPWAFGYIKMSWMKHNLIVEWI